MGCIQNIRSKESKENIVDWVVSRENRTINNTSLAWEFLWDDFNLDSYHKTTKKLSIRFIILVLLTKNEIEKRRDEEFCNVIVICHAIDLSEAANLNLRVLLATTVVPNICKSPYGYLLGGRVEEGGEGGGQITLAWWGGRKGGDNSDRESWRSQIGKCSDISFPTPFVYCSKLFIATLLPFD